MVISRGLANACTVMVGNKIGAQEETAIVYAKWFLVLATVIGIIIGAILSISSSTFLKLFKNLTPEVYSTANKLLKIIGIVFFIKMFNGTMIVGVLRVGGDAKFSMFLEMVSI